MNSVPNKKKKKKHKGKNKMNGDMGSVRDANNSKRAATVRGL